MNDNVIYVDFKNKVVLPHPPLIAKDKTTADKIISLTNDIADCLDKHDVKISQSILDNEFQAFMNALFELNLRRQ